MAGPIRISVLANASQAKRELSDVATTSQRVGAGFRKMALPAVAALGAIGAASFKATQAAADDEAAQVRLAQSLKTAAGATTEQVAATEAWITAQGQALGVTDDELRPAIAKLATATGSVSKAQKLASLAMNISAGSGASLEQVTSALAKAQTGSTLGLKKYGINTKTAAGETKSLAQITEELAGKYRGAASAAAGTAAGQQKKLQLQLGELQEEIGAKLLPVLSKMATFGLKAVEWIGKNQGKVTALVAAIAALAATVLLVNAGMKVYAAGQAIAAVATAAFTLAQKAATAASLGTRIGLAALAVQTAVTSAVTKAAAAAQWVLNAALAANPIGLVIIAIIALVAALVIAYKKSETFRKIVDAAFKAIKAVVSSVVGWFREYVPKVFEFVVNAVKTYVNVYKTVVTTVFNAVKTVVTAAVTVIRTVVTTYFNIVRTVVTTVMNAVKTVVTTVWNAVKSAFTAAAEAITTVVGKVVGAVTKFVSSLKKKFDEAVEFIKGIPGRIVDAIGDLGDLLYDKGKQIIQGLIDGIRDAASSIGGIIDSVIPGGKIFSGKVAVTGAPALPSAGSASRVTSQPLAVITTPVAPTQSDQDTQTMVRLLTAQNKLLTDLIRVETDAPTKFGRELNNSAARAARSR